MIDKTPLIYKYGVAEIAKNTAAGIPLIDIDFDFNSLTSKNMMIDFHYRSFTISQIRDEKNKILSEIRNNQIEKILE